MDRRETFSSDEGRQTYLRLLRQNLGDAAVRLLGCGMLGMEWWRHEPAADWEQVLNAEALESDSPAGRGCTYAGRPFGNEDFVSEMAEGFGRYWTRGRPKKNQALARPAQQETDQFTLF